MHSSKSNLPLHDIRKILASKLFTNEERAIAINRILRKWQINPLFESVLSKEQTFTKYVKEYVEDNLGLGVFDRWKLNTEQSEEFIQNISDLFDVEMWYMVPRSHIVTVSLVKTTTHPPILKTTLSFSIFLTSLLCLFTSFSFLIQTTFIIDAWRYLPLILFILVLTIITGLTTYGSADDPFDDKRMMSKKLLDDAKELDEIIEKYWKE